MRFMVDGHLAHFLSPGLFSLTMTVMEPGHTGAQMARRNEERGAVRLRVWGLVLQQFPPEWPPNTSTFSSVGCTLGLWGNRQEVALVPSVKAQPLCPSHFSPKELQTTQESKARLRTEV